MRVLWRDQGRGSRTIGIAEIRGACRRRGIPHRRGECRTGPFDRAVYRLRARVERTINRCKEFRSLATRYDKHAAS